MSYRRFSDCSTSERMLYTLFILLLSTGYLFAMTMLYITVAVEDGEPGLSIEDISIKYRGEHSTTRLEQALGGIMMPYRTEGEYKKIIMWVNSGASEARFTEDVKPILDAKCIACHNPGSGMNIPDLTKYETVKELVVSDTGDTFATLVRVSHIHLFGLGMVFYLLGRIFILTEMPARLKRIVVVVPFAAIALDIGSWWFTKYSMNLFAFIVMIGGIIMGLSFAFQAFVSLYQMWFFKHPVRQNYTGTHGDGEYERRRQG
ncbi:MAG: hypothetical protein V3V95_06465 [Thermodesulfobacteriota bacterium]